LSPKRHGPVIAKAAFSAWIASTVTFLSSCTTIGVIAPPRPPLVSASSASAFVESLGVDVHFCYYGSIYTTNTPLMFSSLQALGIRHLRDNLCWQGPQSSNAFYIVHQQLASLGFATTYGPSISQPISQITAYPTLVQDMEGIEAASEYDASGDPNWATVVIAQQQAIFQAMNGTRGITVLAPALANPASASQLGDLSSLSNVGNLHGYMGGYNPGNPASNPTIYLTETQPVTPGKPVWVTETGYFGQPGPFNGTYGVSLAAQAIYAPRLLLEFHNAGVARIYLYELADDLEPGQNPADFHWGLLDSTGQPKPAFRAVANLTALLNDSNPHLATTPLAYAIRNGDSSVHQALFEKSDGSYYIALWIEAPSYDFINQQPIAVPTQSVTLQLLTAPKSVTVSQWDDSGNAPTTQITPGTAIPLTLSDRLQIIQLTY
jgi:hypothetical protein